MKIELNLKKKCKNKNLILINSKWHIVKDHQNLMMNILIFGK